MNDLASAKMAKKQELNTRVNMYDYIISSFNCAAIRSDLSLARLKHIQDILSCNRLTKELKEEIKRTVEKEIKDQEMYLYELSNHVECTNAQRGLVSRFIDHIDKFGNFSKFKEGLQHLDDAHNNLAMKYTLMKQSKPNSDNN